MSGSDWSLLGVPSKPESRLVDRNLRVNL